MEEEDGHPNKKPGKIGYAYLIFRILGQRSEGKSRTERQQIIPKFEIPLPSFSMKFYMCYSCPYIFNFWHNFKKIINNICIL
jgi:hypothetical protein